MPANVSETINLAAGVVATIVMSFDVWKDPLSRMEVAGAAGSRVCPDQNTLGGPIPFFRPDTQRYAELRVLYDFAENSRRIGVADVAEAMVFEFDGYWVQVGGGAPGSWCSKLNDRLDVAHVKNLGMAVSH